MRIVKKGLIPLFLAFVIILILLEFYYLQPQEQEPVSQSALTLPVKDSFIAELPQRVYWNSKATVSVEAPPGTSCELSYITPTGELSDADGLGVTTASTEGLCNWKWKIGASGGKGSGRVIIRVGKKSETHFIEIRSGY